MASPGNGSPEERPIALPPSSPRVRRPAPQWLTNLPFVALHGACLAAVFCRVTPAALALCGGFYLVRMFGITAGYHRYFSHRSFKTSRAFQFLLACLGCSALQKGPLWWAAHHRRHHRHADTAADPHSPRQRGAWWAHVGWVLAPDHEATGWHLVRDWARYRELRWLNRHYWLPGAAVAAVCLAVGGWAGLVWGFVVGTVLLYHAVFTVNSLCHLFGRRPYPTRDDSRNNLLVALLTLGEGWHNNHHHCPSAARQGRRWWEVDVSYYLLGLLAVLGLVWDVRRPAGAGRAKRKQVRPMPAGPCPLPRPEAAIL